MPIPRYELYHCEHDAHMSENPEGEYVRFDDFKTVHNMLDELAGEVFGRELGSEPDVYKDYDKLQELHSRVKQVLR